MAVLAEVLAGVVTEAEVADVARLHLHAAPRAPIALGSKVPLDVPGGNGRQVLLKACPPEYKYCCTWG